MVDNKITNITKNDFLNIPRKLPEYEAYQRYEDKNAVNKDTSMDIEDDA